MKRLIAAATLVLTSLAWAAPAFAKDFVQDQAGMFSAGTVAELNQKNFPHSTLGPARKSW